MILLCGVRARDKQRPWCGEVGPPAAGRGAVSLVGGLSPVAHLSVYESNVSAPAQLAFLKVYRLLSKF